MKNGLSEESRRELRRVLGEMESLAPPAPELETRPLEVHPRMRSRPRPLLVTLGAAAAVFVLALPFVLRSPTQDTAVSNRSAPVAGPATTATTTDEQVATTMPVERRPMDGSPQELGVTSVDFITAILPTSPVEYRVSAAWQAMYYNVVNHWFEVCVADQGFVVEVPRASAMDLRRNAVLPDFELDAQHGTFDATDLTWNGSPPQSASTAEAEAWHQAVDECNLDVEKRKSEGFDQVIGRLPDWFDIIREVNDSPEMADTTSRLLSCVSDGGGPEADSLEDLRGAYNSLIQETAKTKDDAVEIGFEMSRLLNNCAGGYDQVRQDLLIPKRDQIVNDYEDVLAEAKPFFDEVLSEALDG